MLTTAIAANGVAKPYYAVRSAIAATAELLVLVYVYRSYFERA